jgi:GNAT superfamily N-acetyltransferase
MTQATSTLVVDAVDALHPQALALLGEAAIEASALYPELFGASSPAPTNLPLRPRETYLLAWRDGQAVGCGALRQHDPFTGEVQRMFVTRGARRDGVARALLERLEQAAWSLGYHRLVLETGVRQAPAIALYSGCGWRRIAPFGRYVGDPTSLCFGKTKARQR